MAGSDAKGSKRCLVLGGSGAVGGAVVRSLAAKGARVAFTWNTGEAAARDLGAQVPGSLPLRVDLRRIDDLERAVDAAASELSGLDALVQCAGVAVAMECKGEQSHHRLPGLDEAAFDELLVVNVKSTFFAVRRAAPVLARGGGGNVVLLGSVDGVKPVPSPVHYAASKGALAGMAQALSKELGEVGIKVNLVAPGILEGGLSRALPESLRKEYVKHCGLRRVGRLDEVASVIAWLALENTYVTGRTLLLDGGL